MFSRNWLLGAAIGGWGLVGTCLIIFVSLDYENRNPIQTQTNDYPCRADQRQPTAAVEIAPQASEQPTPRSQSANEADCVGHEDLAAQRRMAVASEELLSLTGEQVRQTGIGTFWSIVGALATAMAAAATAYAAHAAAIAAKAAERGAEAIPVLERAYLYVTDKQSSQYADHTADLMSATAGDPPIWNMFQIRFAFKNHGKTPARITHVYALIEPFSDPQPPPLLIEGPIEVVIGSGETSSSWACNFKILRTPGIASYHRPDVVFYGRVIYLDVFQKEHNEPFGFHYYPGYPVPHTFKPVAGWRPEDVPDPHSQK